MAGLRPAALTSSETPKPWPGKKGGEEERGRGEEPRQEGGTWLTAPVTSAVYRAASGREPTPAAKRPPQPSQRCAATARGHTRTGQEEKEDGDSGGKGTSRWTDVAAGTPLSPPAKTHEPVVTSTPKPQGPPHLGVPQKVCCTAGRRLAAACNTAKSRWSSRVRRRPQLVEAGGHFCAGPTARRSLVGRRHRGLRRPEPRATDRPSVGSGPGGIRS